MQPVTGSKVDDVQDKHHAEAQDQASATAELLEKVDITDGDTMGAGPQQGGALDPERAQQSGVSALLEHVPL